MRPATLEAILGGAIEKGEALAVARLAAIAGAKRTSEWIPLCHPIPLDGVEVDLAPDPKLPGIRVTVAATAEARTGVEMEALTAVSVAALTLYDMCKALHRGIRITDVSLVHKSGGRSGEWTREPDPEPDPEPEPG